MMYALLIYVKPGTHEALSESESEAVSGEYYAIRGDARCVAGAHLGPVEAATTVRVDNGGMLTTDGPFADTKEVLGGYFIIDVPDLDQALELAGRVPAARLGGSIEVRPVVEQSS